MADEKKFEESAAYFGVSTRTIRRWASDGKLSAPKSGGTMQADFDEDLEGAPAFGSALSQENGTGGFDEMGVPQRVTRVEAERDRDIRRMGQLEHEAARVSWWRRLAACSLLLCLLLALGLAGGAAWAVQELKIRSASIVSERQMVRKALGSHEKAQAEWQQTKAELTGELVASRVAVETEQRERVRLAEELAAAVTRASAANMLDTETAAEAQIRMAGLARDLEIAEQHIAELDQQGQTIDLNELIDLLRQAVAPQGVGDSPALVEGEATASIETPQAEGDDEAEAQPTEEP